MESKNQFKENKDRIKEAEEEKERKSDTIIVDENYPGPKEEDIGKAEKPGIKVQEEDNSTRDGAIYRTK